MDNTNKNLKQEDNKNIDINIEEENGSSISLRVPATYKKVSDELSKKYNISSSEILRICLFYGLANEEGMLKFMAERKIKHIEKNFGSKDDKKIKIVNIEGVNVKYESIKYEINEEENKIIMKFFVGELDIADASIDIMNFNSTIRKN